MHKDDLQAIAQAKIDDADFLFSHRRYSNSYYLFGFGVEIAIKARIARVFSSETIPNKKFVQDIYTHDLDKLINLAGLKQDLNSKTSKSARFAAFWSIASDWSERSRYDMIDAFSATALRNAIQDPEEGIFKWLRTHW
ncbi:DNA-binding protein [Roseibium denhamense]|uniref:HEPN domain-containing protein n=1 Tax=Roseibium denhamense TaxID=76305 RepID=A0ABY1P4U2_9HYPH|nr:DNA-binding protein [Roseibium denhamense]MTI07231.1 DNA-binding protein [Roseibium denhamense]SMP26369.1 hypothetical protein SAMN06265374_2719 [Roseibium denhamense]